MNKKQKKTLLHFLFILALTVIAVLGLLVLRNVINKSEAVKAMQAIGNAVTEYRQQNNTVPPESWVMRIKERIPGSVRLGEINYRARWLDIDSPPDEILAYTKKDYNSLLTGKGYIVLRLSGKVEWIDPNSFKKQLKARQTPAEIQLDPISE
jgi:type II secretory pathway pseudopilin PulG